MNRSDILVPLNLEKHSFEGLELASRIAAEMPVRAALLYVVGLITPHQYHRPFFTSSHTIAQGGISASLTS